jgi:hypothetical protein
VGYRATGHWPNGSEEATLVFAIAAKVAWGVMEQRVGTLSAEDLANIEVGRQWVRDHFTPEARHKYEQVSEELRLLQTILDAGRWSPGAVRTSDQSL